MKKTPRKSKNSSLRGKEGEKPTSRSEALFRRLFESAPDGMVIVNNRHEIVNAMADQARIR